MALLKRFYDIKEFVQPGKVLVILGPRRAGKTTLLKKFLEESPLKNRMEVGDNIRMQELLGSRDLPRIVEYASQYEVLAIDEAQMIPNIGYALKIIVDQIPSIRVIVTGSSSFDLSQAIGEPLTGRKTTLRLYPFAQKELLNGKYTRYELKERLDQFLIFGSYPDVVLADSREVKIRILNELIESYLLKDILALDRVKSPKVLLDLLKLIAFQVGNEVSLGEISRRVGLDGKTVDRYLDLFEKSFVLKRVGGFSRNLRKEVTSKAKYFFVDNGIRNAIISNFQPLDNRDDIGGLFENFCVSEKLKLNAYHGYISPLYFWRTYDRQEIDFIDERDGILFASECKWSPRKQGVIIPPSFRSAYPQAEFSVIHRENCLDVLTA
jgi:predicted AAA+ superfamily ATPase